MSERTISTRAVGLRSALLAILGVCGAELAVAALLGSSLAAVRAEEAWVVLIAAGGVGVIHRWSGRGPQPADTTSPAGFGQNRGHDPDRP